MAVNQIQFTPRQAKKDTLDRILQGLQIAEAAFKIPVNYEQYKVYSAEADLKQAEADSIKKYRDTGNADAIAQQKLNLVPNRGGVLLPGQTQASNYVTKEQDQARYDRTKDIRSAYANEVAPVKVAAVNYQNVMDGLNENRDDPKGNQQGQLKAMFNAMKLYQPNISRGADGRIVGEGGGLPEELYKQYNKLLGNKNILLTSNEEAELAKSARSAFAAQVAGAKKAGDVAIKSAQIEGIPREHLGIDDFHEQFGLALHGLKRSIGASPVPQTVKTGAEAEARRRGLLK
jgi:hypothetical protein